MPPITASSAPFDITDLPNLAWVPGPLTWALFALGIALCAAYLVYSQRSRSPKKYERKLIRLLIKDLEALVDSSHEPLPERGFSVARRLACIIVDPLSSSLSPRELRAKADAMTDSAHKQILIRIAEMGDSLYSGAQPARPEVTRKALHDIRSAAQEILDQRERTGGV